MLEISFNNISKFKKLYYKHYGIDLKKSEAEQKLMSFLVVLQKLREKEGFFSSLCKTSLRGRRNNAALVNLSKNNA